MQYQVLCLKPLGLIIKLDKLSLVQSPVDGPQQAVVSEFPEVGKTTGTRPGTYQIKLTVGSQGVVHPPHKQPAALKEKIVDQLKEMVAEGHITKIECPTEWMSSHWVVLMLYALVQVFGVYTEVDFAVAKSYYHGTHPLSRAFYLCDVTFGNHLF